MSDLDPSARDELLAAYLDGEATAAERDLIRNDPELLARAELLSTIVSMVGAPVAPPDHDTREAHIAAALAASSTSPVVTSISRPANRRPDVLRIASIAAVVMAVMLAVPLLLLGGGGGGDDFDAAGTDATTNDGAVDGDAMVRSSADAEAAPLAGDTAAAAEDVAGDLATAESGTAEDSAIEPGAEELAADETAGAEALAPPIRRIDLGPVDDLDALVAAIADADATGGAQAEDTATDIATLGCAPIIAGTIDATAVGGTVTFAGTPAEYLTAGTPPEIVVVATDGCRELARG